MRERDPLTGRMLPATNWEANFWEKVVKRTKRHALDVPGCCWAWTGLHSQNGRPRFKPPGQNQRLAYHIAYELLVGPINDETLDHLCEHGWCVNPFHLAPASKAANHGRWATKSKAATAARATCRNGHPWIEENIYVMPKGYLACRACRRDAIRRWRAA